MRTISLKLPEDLLDRLAREARTRGTTKSSLVRESLEKSLRVVPSDASPSCYDLAADLAGCLKGDVPLDLANNSEYMDGFGE